MSEGLLSQFDPEAVGTVPEPRDPQETSSLLSSFDPDTVGALPEDSTATGAFLRGAERGVLPSIGGMAAAGAGAELGALAGAPLGPIGSAVGGIAGGLAGAVGGGSLVAAAQNYALSKLPDTWVEALGQDERQQQLDESKHNIASFLGGVAPFVLTMRPGMAPKVNLPENATAMQRVLANPATARIFGGGAMGGMELGSELINGDAPDWTKVAISTGVGAVLNRPTRFGEYLLNAGARPFKPATVAEAHDMKVMGPGVTESVFRGGHEIDPEAAKTAAETRRAEMEVTGEVTPAGPDLHSIARTSEPELFLRYDELTATRNELRNWLEEYRNPDYGQIDVAMQAMEDARAAYDAHVEAAKGYTGGPEARRLRAGIREAEKAYDLLFARRREFGKGNFADTPESAQVRDRLMAVDVELRDIGREVAAAYRRAAEFGGGDVVEPMVPTVEEAPAQRNAFGGLLPLAEGERPAAAPTDAGVAPAAPAPVAAAPEARPAKSLAEQKATIAEDVAQQLIAAGRPDAEARAAGQLIAERYATRAARFNGALGTAEELYNREGARIRGAGGAPAPAMAPSEPVAPIPMAPITAKDIGKISAPERPVSLLEFLSDKGLAPSPELKAIFDKENPRYGKTGLVKSGGVKLMREGGRSVDDALRAAVEAGYFHDPAAVGEGQLSLTPADLLNAIRSEHFGEKIYQADKGAFTGLATAEKDTKAYNAEMRAERQKVLDSLPLGGWEDDFITTVDGKNVIDRAADYIRTGEETDPRAAWYRAYEEFVNEQASVAEASAMSSAWDEFYQSAKGKITFRPGQKPIITLMRDADASTFIHETGHDFLEQMIRDAKHEAAPDILKEDAKTIRDWLGVKANAEIKTAHHEKFARGFEQYLREGVAPSKELAGVFAKFKQWLLRIYETIRGLGAPINDDIRGVFDRMLAEEPTRTVIAPEMERQPTIHDIHETDARLTEPEEAAPAADRVAAERERAIAEVPGDIADEIQAEITARTDGGGPVGEGVGGTGEMGVGGVQPQPVAQGRDMGARDRAERGGGSDAAPEGVGLFPEDATPLSPRPRQILGTEEPKFVDKAGNIRVENLTTSEDVASAIHEASIANDEFMGARRGVVSDGQVMDLASDIGLEGAFDLVQGWVKGRAYNAEQVMALRKLLVDSAQKVHAAMQKAATGSDQDVMAYAMARDRHQMIQRTVAGATAEAGRALRAFRDITVEAGGKEFNQRLKEATGKTLFQLRQEAQLGLALDSPQQVSAFMQAAQKPNFLRMLLEYWINALISGPKSQLTYAIGNSMLSLHNFGPETVAAALIGSARRRMGREGETVRLGEALAALKGAKEGFAPALKAAGTAAKTGVSTLLPGEPRRLTPFETESNMAPRGELDEAYKLNQVMPDLFGALRGIREAVLATGAQLKAGGVSGAPMLSLSPSLRGDIPNVAVRGVDVLPVGEVARLPSRMNAVFDSFFRSLNYSMDKAAQAYRMAENEGLTGVRFDGRVAELLANPTPEMMEGARKTAGDISLLDKGGDFTRKVMSVFNTPVGGAPVLKFIAPFVRVAANTLDQTVIKRTPVGLLSAELRADLLGKNGTIAQDRAQARMAVGSALSMLFGSLAAEGLITGSGPTDPKEAAIWRMAGNQPHSVKIGDMWYDVRGLGPLGMLSGITADAYDALQKVNNNEEADKIAYAVMHAFAQNLLDQSFMKGPYDLIKAVDQPERYGAGWVRNFASAFVPFSVGAGQIARSIDPYSREARTVLDAMKAKIPGLSQELMPRRDIFGEEIPNKKGALGNLTTLYATKAESDPVVNALMSARYFPSKVDRKIRNVELTNQQYDDYARIAGRMTKQRLDVLVNSPDFERLPQYSRHDIIKAQVEASRETARNVMMAKYPQIVQDAVDAVKAARQRQ
jgi:hypothetical protein